MINQYSYDAQGNRIAKNNQTAIYDGQDRLLSAGPNIYSTSADGEITSIKNTSGATKNFIYNSQGLLIGATLPDGKQISYIIDAENNRYIKSINNIIRNYYEYDEFGRLVAEFDSNRGLKFIFVYADDTTSPSYMMTGGKEYSFIKDQIGTIKMVIDASSGIIAEQIEYDEFGNVLSDTAPGFQPFGFASGLYDQDTKLVRFGARDYDPETGRWTSKDPILFYGGDTNLYGYVGSDPVNFVDPRGLWAFQVGGSIGGLLGPIFGVGGSAESGMAISYSAQYGFQIAGYQSAGVRAGLGLYGGASLNLSLTPDAQRVSDLNGGGITKGFDTPLGGYSNTTSGGMCGNPEMTTHTIGFGPGVIGDAYWGATGTRVGAPLIFGGSQ